MHREGPLRYEVIIYWSAEDEENAEWAVKGEYRRVAERLKKRRVKL